MEAFKRLSCRNGALVVALVVALALTLLLSACGSGPAPTSTPEEVVQAPTDTPLPPTDTPVPPTPTPVPPTPTATSAPENLTWDYVALGDSIVAVHSRYASYAAPYAAHIEADLGVEVRLDNWGVPGMRSAQLLDRLRNNQMLRDEISEAEVVTLVIGADDVNWPLVDPNGSGDCGGADTTDCLRDALESFRVNYDAIIAELFMLCSSKTIIRTMTYHNYGLGYWGVDEDPRPFIGPLNDHIVQAASENNIPVAVVHLVFNGPDGDKDPADKGYLAYDGVHTSELGAAVIADLHQELGYEYTCP